MMAVEPAFGQGDVVVESGNVVNITKQGLDEVLKLHSLPDSLVPRGVKFLP